MTTLAELIATGEPFADDDAARAWLRQPVTVQNDATNGDVLSWAATHDALARLRTYSAGTDAATRGLADAALSRVNAGLGLSLSDASVQGLLAALVAQGMFTQAEIDELNGGSQAQIPRWKTSTARAVSLQIVANARAQ